MEEFSNEAKIAIIRILVDIMKADNIVKDVEIEYLNQLVDSFGLSKDFRNDADNFTTLKALSIIKELPLSQKEIVAKLMGKMIIIDQDINYNEVKSYNIVCESCNIDKDFNIDDYPDYTLSGPFINPEDLMNKPYV